jgi:hypothetical protein
MHRATQKEISRFRQEEILRIRHSKTNSRTMPIKYEKFNSSPFSQRVPTCQCKGCKEQKQMRTRDEMNGLQNAKLYKLNEYNAGKVDEDESEMHNLWAIYADPTDEYGGSETINFCATYGYPTGEYSDPIKPIE